MSLRRAQARGPAPSLPPASAPRPRGEVRQRRLLLPPKRAGRAHLALCPHRRSLPHRGCPAGLQAQYRRRLKPPRPPAGGWGPLPPARAGALPPPPSPCRQPSSRFRELSFISMVTPDPLSRSMSLISFCAGARGGGGQVSWPRHPRACAPRRQLGVIPSHVLALGLRQAALRWFPSTAEGGPRPTGPSSGHLRPLPFQLGPGQSWGDRSKVLLSL